MAVSTEKPLHDSDSQRTPTNDDKDLEVAATKEEQILDLPDDPDAGKTDEERAAEVNTCADRRKPSC